MAVTTDRRRFVTRDGGEVDAHVAFPDAGVGPGVVLVQEALGVNDYLRAVATRLARVGYVVMAPDVYWRLERNVVLDHDDAGLQRAVELLGRLDGEAAVRDLEDALTHLRSVPEVTNGVGVVGFCLGGRLAYEVACAGDPDCAVSYYGVGIEEQLDRAATLTCPILFHFGTDDAFVPRDAVERVRDALQPQANVQVALHEGAGHAFDNPEAAWHDAGAAASAWEQTTAFLGAHLRAG